MEAGRLDRRIQLEQRSVTRAADGSETVTWSLVADLWAQIVPLRGQERYGAGAEQPERDARVRIRWRSGVSAGMRIVHEERVWDIQAVLEVGRREGLDLLCSGQQP
jgi:SPP1 family predicted phage head-tail adaptor